MKKTIRHKTFNLNPLSAGVLAGALVVPCLAQAAEQYDLSMLEEIVVTAQGRVQSLDDVPVSVSVVSGQALEDLGISSLQDVSARMPNVNIATGPFDLINVRGVGSGNNGGFQQSVGTFVDGIYRSRSRSSQAALFDIDRVEVLKGPQTTFFGANSIAGALNITTRGPGDEFDYNMSALYGSHGEYNVEGGVDLPISETLSMRVAGRFNGMDGYINTREDDAPNSDGSQFRVSLKWSPSDNFESDFRIDYGDSESKGALAFQLVGCPVPEGFANGTACQAFLDDNGGSVDDKLDYNSDTALDFINFEFLETAWTNTFDVGNDAQLILKTGYYEHKSRSMFTGIPFPNSVALAGVDDPFPLLIDEDYDQFSQEIRFQTDTGGVFDYMVGAYYSDSSFDYLNVPGFFFNDFGFITTAFVLPGFLANAPADVVAATEPLWSTHTIAPGELYAAKLTNHSDDKTYSAFVAFTLRPLEGLTVNVGGRYTKVEKTASRESLRGRTDASLSTFDLLNPADDFVLNLTLGGDSTDFTPNKRKDDDFMPSLSVQYDLTENMMVYGSYAEGFKAGGFSAANNPDIFEPEYVDAYELGLKGTFMDGRLRASATYFFNDYSDLQESAVVSQGVSLVSVVRNAAASESEGLEFDGVYLVNENIQLNASLAVLRSEYQDFANAPCSMRQAIEAGGSQAPCFQDLSGKERAYAPEWSGNIGARFNVPAGAYNVSIEPSVYFTDDLYLSAEADDWLHQDSYYKLDLRVALTPESEKWSLALIGKNLNDETTSSFASPVTNSDGSARYLVDRPRSVALQFTSRY